MENTIKERYEDKVDACIEVIKAALIYSYFPEMKEEDIDNCIIGGLAHSLILQKDVLTKDPDRLRIALLSLHSKGELK